VQKSAADMSNGDITQANARLLWKRFLQSTPPNTALLIPHLATARKYSSSAIEWTIPVLPLELHCEIDSGVRWFDPQEKSTGLGYQFLRYTCRNCNRFMKVFAVFVTKPESEEANVTVMKLGEYLPFSAPISKRISKLLEKDDLELYRQGTRAEAQGLGIGAATYFRRIVDNKWQLLVTEIRDAAAKLGAKDLSVFDAAVKETQFSKAVDMLKDAIPQKLLILDGENPLTLLYKVTSVGLHNLTDEECLQQAADIRMVLTALLENIADVLKDQNELKSAVARLKQLKT